eukprot:7378298-Ditylum_brightwellii.AAC.1
MEAWVLDVDILCDEQMQVVLQRKIYAHGVTRKNKHGLPPCVLQEEVTSKEGQIAVQGTVKATIPKRDPDHKVNPCKAYRDFIEGQNMNTLRILIDYNYCKM